MEDDTNPTNLDSTIIRPRRSYKCTNCKRLCARNEVGKSSLGLYYCKICGGLAVDNTNEDTGHDFLEILNV